MTTRLPPGLEILLAFYFTMISQTSPENIMDILNALLNIQN